MQVSLVGGGCGAIEPDGIAALLLGPGPAIVKALVALEWNFQIFCLKERPTEIGSGCDMGWNDAP